MDLFVARIWCGAGRRELTFFWLHVCVSWKPEPCEFLMQLVSIRACEIWKQTFLPQAFVISTCCELRVCV